MQELLLLGLFRNVVITNGIAILFNNLVAMWWLGERIVYKYDIPAFILIVAGSTAIVLLSVEGEAEYTP